MTSWTALVLDLLDDNPFPAEAESVKRTEQLARPSQLDFRVVTLSMQSAKREELHKKLITFIQSSSGESEGRAASKESAFNVMALAPPPPAVNGQEERLQQMLQSRDKQLASACALRDFHMCEPVLDGVPLLPVVAASPRAAQRLCASFVTERTVQIVRRKLDEVGLAALQCSSEELRRLQGDVNDAVKTDVEDEALEEKTQEDHDWLEQTEPQEDTKPNDGAIYCEDCKIWLNGPKQCQEHKIGKRHKKTMQRQNSQQAPRANPPRPQYEPQEQEQSAQQSVQPTSQRFALQQHLPDYRQEQLPYPPWSQQVAAFPQREQMWQCAPWLADGYPLAEMANYTGTGLFPSVSTGTGLFPSVSTCTGPFPSVTSLSTGPTSLTRGIIKTKIKLQQKWLIRVVFKKQKRGKNRLSKQAPH